MKLNMFCLCLFSVVLACFAAPACDVTSTTEGGSSPQILDLVCEPDEISIQTATRVDCTVDFSDPQGDPDVLEVNVYDPFDNPGQPEEFDMSEVEGTTEGSFEFQIDMFPSAEGRHTIEAKIVDLEGNTSSTKKTNIDATL